MTNHYDLMMDMYHDALRGCEKVMRTGTSVEKLEAYKRMKDYDLEIAHLLKLVKRGEQNVAK